MTQEPRLGDQHPGLPAEAIGVIGWAFRPTLPVRPTRYASFWRTPAWSWWRPIVALAVGVIAVLVASVVFSGLAIAFDFATGRRDAVTDPAQPGALVMTAPLFLANNLVLASLIPIAFVVAWLVFRQRPGWLASVTGRFRWGWFGRCLLLITPLWALYTGIDAVLALRGTDAPQLAVNSDTWLLIVGILLTTPLQAAGEEYGFRGLLNRIGASFFADQRAGLVVGAVISSVGFMFAHGAGDPWLNGYYFSFGLMACFVTWRTGGLEAAIALHVVNNMFGEVFLPFSDVSHIFDRQAGTAGPEMLIGAGVALAGTVLLTWQGRRRGLTAESAPGESMAMAMAAADRLASVDQTIPTPPMPPPPMLPRPPLPKPLPVPPPGEPRPPSTRWAEQPPPLVNPRPWEL